MFEESSIHKKLPQRKEKEIRWNLNAVQCVAFNIWFPLREIQLISITSTDWAGRNFERWISRSGERVRIYPQFTHQGEGRH